MRGALGRTLLAAGLALTPALVAGQQGMPGLELGADLALYHGTLYPTGFPSLTHFVVVTPVDLRIGFIVRQSLVIEPRLGLLYESNFLQGKSLLQFTPDFNFLLNVGSATYRHGMYLMAGVGTYYWGGSSGRGLVQLALNGGVGTRVPYGSAAMRVEAFVKYLTKAAGEGELQIGGRVGLSLWDGAGAAAAPGVAPARSDDMEMPAHEFGMDLTASRDKIVFVGATSSPSSFDIVTPVAIRVGFVASRRLVIEPRFMLEYDSQGFGTISNLRLMPDVNVLFSIGGGNYRRGVYVTGGAGLNIQRIGGSSKLDTAQPQVNGGIGTRVPVGSAALRLEAFVSYATHNVAKDVPSQLRIGGRVGWSLWR